MVCEGCYNVLCSIVHKHEKNAVHLSQYLDEIQEQLVLKLGAARVLLEMLKGNVKLIRYVFVCVHTSICICMCTYIGIHRQTGFRSTKSCMYAYVCMHTCWICLKGMLN